MKTLAMKIEQIDALRDTSDLTPWENEFVTSIVDRLPPSKDTRGMECQIRIPLVCNHNPETTVWAHANGSAAGKGIGMKSPDLLVAYACSACHDAVDGRAGSYPGGWNLTEIRMMFHEGHQRSLRILIEKGLV